MSQLHVIIIIFGSTLTFVALTLSSICLYNPVFYWPKQKHSVQLFHLGTNTHPPPQPAHAQFSIPMTRHVSQHSDILFAHLCAGVGINLAEWIHGSASVLWEREPSEISAMKESVFTQRPTGIHTAVTLCHDGPGSLSFCSVGTGAGDADICATGLISTPNVALR